MLAVNFSQTARAQASISLLSENIYQLVDICRLKVVYLVNPFERPSFSLIVAVQYNGNNDNHYQVALNGAGGIIVLPSDNSLPYFYHSRVVPSTLQLETSTSPYEVTHYFDLPRNAADTEFTLVAEPNGLNLRTDRAYSIAKDCPKGN